MHPAKGSDKWGTLCILRCNTVRKFAHELKEHEIARLEAFKSLVLKTRLFFDVTLSCRVSSCRRYEGSWCIRNVGKYSRNDTAPHSTF